MEQQNSVTYLTKDFEPIEEDDPRIAMVEIRKSDGSVTFGTLTEGKLFTQTFEGHQGRPGKVGGSLPRIYGTVSSPSEKYAEYGKTFQGMEEKGRATSKANKKWIKENQERYNNDPEFRAMCDYIGLYTQGSYEELRAIAQYKLTGEFPEKYMTSDVPEWENDDLSASSSPMASYKNFFEGQNLEAENLGVTSGEAAMSVEKAIANSPDINYSIYRGVAGYKTSHSVLKPGRTGDGWDDYEMITDTWPPMPKVGDTFDFAGATSFSADPDLARRFSEGATKGTGGKGLGRGAWATFVYEIEPGAKGLEVSALSPWSQSEVVTSGRYEIVSVERDPINTYVKVGRGYNKEISHYRVKVKQTGVWDV